MLTKSLKKYMNVNNKEDSYIKLIYNIKLL